jgi:hypothetical protein
VSRYALITVILLTLSPTAYSDVSLDGTSWLALDGVARTWYLSGYFDAQAGDRAYCASHIQLQGYSARNPSAESSSIDPIDDVCGFLIPSKALVGQIKDGVTRLYSNPLNRLIKASHAIAVVVSAINGMSGSDAEAAIKKWRRVDGA